jgi:hypothetical protein
MFATCSFVHLDLVVSKGDELPVDHPMVIARPDLFTDQTPKKSTKKEA